MRAKVEWVDMMGLDSIAPVLYVRFHVHNPNGRQVPGLGGIWQKSVAELDAARRQLVEGFLNEGRTLGRTYLKALWGDEEGEKPTLIGVQMSRGFGKTEYEINVRFRHADDSDFVGELLFSVLPGEKGELNYREELPAKLVTDLKRDLASFFTRVDDLAQTLRFGGKAWS